MSVSHNLLGSLTSSWRFSRFGEATDDLPPLIKAYFVRTPWQSTWRPFLRCLAPPSAVPARHVDDKPKRFDHLPKRAVSAAWCRA